MQIRIASPAPALAAASVSTFQIAGIAVEGPFLVFDFAGADSLTDRLDVVANWEAVVGQFIADANDANDINSLTALKRAINDVTRDVQRESYIPSSTTNADEDGFTADGHLGDIAYENDIVAQSDAAVSDAGSHPTSTGDASTSLSSQSNQASSDIEEQSNEQAHQQVDQPRRSRQRD